MSEILDIYSSSINGKASSGGKLTTKELCLIECESVESKRTFPKYLVENFILLQSEQINYIISAVLEIKPSSRA